MTTGNTPVQRWLSTKVTQCLSARPLMREPPPRSSLRGHARRPRRDPGPSPWLESELLAHSVELDVRQCGRATLVKDEVDRGDRIRGRDSTVARAVPRRAQIERDVVGCGGLVRATAEEVC